MLFEPKDFIHRVNGVPLYYNGLTTLPLYPSAQYEYQPQSPSPPYTNYDVLMSKLPAHTSPLTLTPPISPLPEQQSRRDSVIMKVENCQVIPAAGGINEQHVCRWENCYRMFESLEKLAAHVSMAHSSIGFNNLYYCKWEGCQRSERGFNARYKMLVHCRTHTKEKPHFCTYQGCSKAFSRAENLKIHFRSHTFEKPYRCLYPGCSKAYSNSSDRFKHRRTHENGKPYQCKVVGCGKRYTDPSSLRKHVKTFNHETLVHCKSPELIRSAKNCEITLTSYTPKKTLKTLYFDSVSSTEHSESNDETFWSGKHDDTLIEMANIRLDQPEQPLDLRIRHT